MVVEEILALMFTVAMFAGVFVVYLALRQRSLVLEMQHRERMAMIERGQIPLADPSRAVRGPVAGSGASSRAMSGGIIVVGIGLALMSVISIAGESPAVGVGVGGALAVLGGAFIIRSLIVKPEPVRPPAPAAGEGPPLP
jgi:hypothetical protein